MLFRSKRPISLKLPPARPKSVYLPTRRAPVSKFGCMSPRRAAFRIDSGQIRFTMMRTVTVILRDSNLGAKRPRQIDKTSLSKGRVVTFSLSQTDTVGGAGAFNSTENSSRVGQQSDYALRQKLLQDFPKSFALKPKVTEKLTTYRLENS